MTNKLAELQRRYNALAQRVSPTPTSEYMFLTVRSDNGAPHVEYVNGEYRYMSTERGLDLSCQTTADPDEMLYWLVYDLTFWMGVKFEFEHRVEDQDGRRIMFAHWRKLMQQADEGMAARLEIDIAEILDENPYLDQATPK